MNPTGELTAALASSFAHVALANVTREYPNKLDHVINDASEVLAPRALHPAFYGSYDWHSCVHMHWLLARLLRLHPQLPEAARIVHTFDAHLNPMCVQREVAYLHGHKRQTFERPYGWAWLLKLQLELRALASQRPPLSRWAQAVQTLADIIADRYLHFMPLAQYPVRAGTHGNSAFSLLFALDYAERAGHITLAHTVREKARYWFAGDRAYPAHYEPGGEDFLSGGLTEAALMTRVMDMDFEPWWARFCPGEQLPETWLRPIAVSERRDPKLVHLDGLNLARAWCWRLIRRRLPMAQQPGVDAIVRLHLDASLPHATEGDYAGTHWLASFALLALTDE